jgi:hypothetical protein
MSGCGGRVGSRGSGARGGGGGGVVIVGSYWGSNACEDGEAQLGLCARGGGGGGERDNGWRRGWARRGDVGAVAKRQERTEK